MIPVEPLDFPSDFAHEDDDDERAYAVRPYTLTGGRTRSTTTHLPVEALVQGLVAADSVSTTPERRRILELTSTQYLSVAELSAHIKVPVGVIRVLVGDLSDEGLIRVHGLTSTAHVANLTVLEMVLNGISSL